MNEYTNPDFEPRLNLFNDDYHLPDDDYFDSDYMSRVKKIRRRYRNYFDYLDAVQLYNEYMDSLAEKYGGKRNLKLQLMLNKVHEYLPNFPELRKIRKFKYARKNKLTREDVAEKNIHFENFEPVEIDMNAKCKVVVDNRSDFDSDMMVNGGRVNDEVIKRIAAELDFIDNYYHKERIKIERMKGGSKKKAKLRNSLNRKALRMSTNYRSLTDKIREYDKRKKDLWMGIVPETGDMINYKGTMFTLAEAEEHNALDMMKNFGVVFGHLSKRQTKLIRPGAAKKKKDKKLKKKLKKRNKIEGEFLQGITRGEYDDMEEFAADMESLTGSRRWD